MSDAIRPRVRAAAVAVASLALIGSVAALIVHARQEPGFAVLDVPVAPHDALLAPEALMGRIEPGSSRWLADIRGLRAWIAISDDPGQSGDVCLVVQAIEDPQLSAVACAPPSGIVADGRLWLYAELGPDVVISLYLVPDGATTALPSDAVRRSERAGLYEGAAPLGVAS